MAGRVFLSYGREDKAVSRRVAGALDAKGYSVWWDPEIKAGAAYARSITRALVESDCVVVLWSEHSVDSDWVQAEADKGWKRGILVPALIDDVEPPMPFGRLETIDIVRWAAQEDQDGLAALEQAVLGYTAPLEPVTRWVQALTEEGGTRTTRQGPLASWISGVVQTGDDTVVVGSGDGLVHILSAPGGEPLASATGHRGPVWSVAAKRDVVLTGGADGVLRQWTAPSLEPVRTFEGHTGWVLGCAITPDATTFASASRDETVRLWDPTGGERAYLSGHTGAVWKCVFSPDGRLLATTSDDQTVRLWSVRERAPVHVLRGHGAPVMAAVFGPDGGTLVTGGYDGTARVWSVASGTELFHLGGGEDWILSLAVTSDGSTVFAGTKQGSVQVWDLSAHELVSELALHDGPVLSLDFRLPIGLVSGSADKTVAVVQRRPVRSSK